MNTYNPKTCPHLYALQTAYEAKRAQNQARTMKVAGWFIIGSVAVGIASVLIAEVIV